MAPRLSFFFAVGLNFYEEVAKLRAARRLWARMVRDKFAPQKESSLILRCVGRWIWGGLSARLGFVGDEEARMVGTRGEWQHKGKTEGGGGSHSSTNHTVIHGTCDAAHGTRIGWCLCVSTVRTVLSAHPSWRSCSTTTVPSQDALPDEWLLVDGPGAPQQHHPHHDRSHGSSTGRHAVPPHQQL